MSTTRSRFTERTESAFSERTSSGAKFYTRSQKVGDLGAVIRRFPRRPGATGGPQFVLVHGIGVSGRYYMPLAAELARYGSVWLIDLPGYGSAPRAGRNVSISDHAGVVAAVIESSGIQSPVLVGHSMGCQVITEVAVQQPELASSLVLLAPTINPAERSLIASSFRLAQDLLTEPIRANFVVGTDYFFRCGPPYFARQLKHLLGDRIEERLVQIETPTLVIVGHRDPVVKIDWAEQASRLLPNGRLKIVQGPHVIMYTDPVTIADHIMDHVS